MRKSIDELAAEIDAERDLMQRGCLHCGKQLTTVKRLATHQGKCRLKDVGHPVTPPDGNSRVQGSKSPVRKVSKVAGSNRYESIRVCECGEPLEPRKMKCSTCLLRNHPGSSTCPFCGVLYLTHAASGKGETHDRKVRFWHADAKCIRSGAA